MEVVHDGWLLKSPPPKRLWRAKWRNRWFVLRSGELPGQYILEYYTDSSCRKLKGKIDLDQCEQVDAGITFAQSKFEYKYMFDIKTPKRVYYLCAETDEAMNKWVESVCQVCGLRVMNQDDLYDPLLPPPTPLTATSPPMPFVEQVRPIEYPIVDSPPPSASSSISGPYIPISECITGKKPHSPPSTKFPFPGDDHLSLSNDGQRCSIPNEMAPPAPLDINSRLTGAKPKETIESNRSLRPSTTTTVSDDTSSILSPSGTEAPYVVFSDDEKSSNLPIENNYPYKNKEENLPSDGEAHNMPAPPRPPKPPHLIEGPQQTYMNLSSFIKANVRRNSSSEKSKPVTSVHLTLPESSISSSDAEPSPASLASSVTPITPKESLEDDHKVQHSDSVTERHRRPCLNSYGPNSVHGRVFSYEINAQQLNDRTEMDPRISPLGTYTNFSQQSKKYVPPVDRGLKPKKTSDSMNLSPFELSPPISDGTIADHSPSIGVLGTIPAPPSSAPPIVDRNLKPHKKTSDPSSLVCAPTFVLDPAPSSRLRNPDSRKPRAAPSPTPPSLRNGKNESDTDCDSISSPGSRRDSTSEEQNFFPLNAVNRRSSSHEIQYLDLDLEAQILHGSPKTPKASNAATRVPLEPSVVYKKVDFVKTEAFNMMRQNIEEGYRKNY